MPAGCPLAAPSAAPKPPQGPLRKRPELGGQDLPGEDQDGHIGSAAPHHASLSGARGASLYHIDESDPSLGFSNDSQYGALRLVLRPQHAHYSFVTAAGRVLDRGNVSCHG